MALPPHARGSEIFLRDITATRLAVHMRAYHVGHDTEFLSGCQGARSLRSTPPPHASSTGRAHPVLDTGRPLSLRRSPLCVKLRNGPRVAPPPPPARASPSGAWLVLVWCGVAGARGLRCVSVPRRRRDTPRRVDRDAFGRCGRGACAAPSSRRASSSSSRVSGGASCQPSSAAAANHVRATATPRARFVRKRNVAATGRWSDLVRVACYDRGQSPTHVGSAGVE